MADMEGGKDATRSPGCWLTVGVGEEGPAGQLSDPTSAEVPLVLDGVPLLLGGVTPPLLLDGVPLLPEAKGEVVIAVSCDPAAMGPLGLAGQDPRGLTGDVIPNGMVPGSPTDNPPTNSFRLAPWY